MRIFTLLVAAIALVASIACLLMIPRYAAMYDDMGAELPTLTRMVVGSAGLLAVLYFLIAVETPEAP